MRLLEKKTELNVDNFVPTTTLTIEVNIEDMVDGYTLLGKRDFSSLIGQEFLTMLGVINERKD